MNLIEKLREQAQANPDRPALVDRKRGCDRTLTYAELWSAIGAGARELRDAGLKKGDTIVFLHPVSQELYLALLSTLHAGMTAMFIDPSAEKSFIEGCCQMHTPQGFFASPKAHLLRLTLPPVRRIPKRFHPSGFVPGSTRLRFRGEPSEPISLEPDHPALVTFTSGSTGKPKAIVRSHQFLLDQHAALASALDYQPGEVELITLPVFVLANLASGMTSVLADSDLAYPAETDPRSIAAQCRLQKPTRCAASPAFFQRLLTHPESLQTFEAIYTGGAPVFPKLLSDLHQAAPQTAIYSVYGSSEAEPIAHISYDEISPDDREAMSRGRGLLTGHPVAEVEVGIIENASGTPLGPSTTEEFRARLLPPESAGEIVVTGKHVLKGYLNGLGDEETKIHVDGTVWHRTGDAGRFDASGRLWLLGRASAKLAATATHPETYPFSIECALSEFPGVIRSAAFDHKGLRMVAIEGHLIEREALKEIFAWAGVEKWIFLPKNVRIPVDRRHNAKVDYNELKSVAGPLSRVV